MYLIVIAWMYVVLMMSVAEATSSNGTLLGALVTLVLYGVGPVALVVYLMGAPARSKAIKQREAEARARHSAAAGRTQARQHLQSSSQMQAAMRPVVPKPLPADAGIAPVGKEP